MTFRTWWIYQKHQMQVRFSIPLWRLALGTGVAGATGTSNHGNPSLVQLLIGMAVSATLLGIIPWSELISPKRT